MYTRSFFDKNEGQILVPDGYDGTALTREPIIEEIPILKAEEAMIKETKISPKDTSSECLCDKDADICEGHDEGGFFGYIKNWFGGLLDKISFPPKINTEDILILGLAAYLFFSKSGDKECAVLIALLIFL